MMPRAEPIGDLNHAWSCLRAAEHLDQSLQSGELDLDFDCPIRLLVGHAIELLCKSFLRDCGWDDKASRELGHDLEACFGAASTLCLGLKLSATEREHLYLLNSDFGRMNNDAVRYLQTGVWQPPDNGIVFAIARNMMDRIEPKLCLQRIKTVGLRTQIEPSRAVDE